MDLACSGLLSQSRQLLSSGGAGSHDSAAAGHEQHCTCLDVHVPGTEVEKVVMLACLWVAFCLSVIILAYYTWCTYKGHCGWEEVYVVTIEMLKTIMEVFFETYTPATILQFNGTHISWLRYSEWLLTCPVILIHLSNLTGLGHYNKRTMRLLVSDIGTIVCGVTAALSTGPTKIVFFLFGLCYGSSTFLTAASVYMSAYKEVPKGECQTLVKLCAWVFFGSWLLFPILFLMGPEGFGHLTIYGSIIAHTFADLLSKNLWGLLAHHLRNKIEAHIHKYGSIEAGPEGEEETEGAAAKLGKEPMTPRTAAAVAHAAVNSDAIATITLGNSLTRGSFKGSPTKSQANLGRSTSGVWSTIGAGSVSGPVRVLLGLPSDAEAVLQHFQQQFAALPIPAEALPAIGPAALLSAAANAAAFNGADAALLHLSYVQPGAASGLNVVGTLKELGIRVYLYGCDVGGPAEDLLDAAGVDGWIEGPTWASPLNSSQLTALLLLLNASHTGSRPPSSQGYSQPASPRAVSLRANSLGPILRSHSYGNLVGPSGPTTGASGGKRNSFDVARMGLSPVRTNTLGSLQLAAPGLTAAPVAAAATAPSTSAPPAAPGTAAAAIPGDASLSDAALLQQLMAEIARLRKELGDAR